MKVQGSYDNGLITLTVPVRVRRKRFPVEVEIPDHELEPRAAVAAAATGRPAPVEGIAAALDRIMGGYRGLEPAGPNPIGAFRGRGKGGGTERLLSDRGEESAKE